MIRQALGILVHLSRSFTFHFFLQIRFLYKFRPRKRGKALIGILHDVSGSMRRNVGSGIDEDGVPWALSIFEVIDNLIKYDVSPDNFVFALAFGATGSDQLLDILTRLESSKCDQKAADDQKAKVGEGVSATYHQMEEIFQILEGAGARCIPQMGKVETRPKSINTSQGLLISGKSRVGQRFSSNVCPNVPTIRMPRLC